MKKELLINGKKVVYDVSGEGRPVLLVHGFGEDRSIWRHQVAFLQNRYRIIVPDLPGTGESILGDDMRMEGMAAVLRSIIDMENIGEQELVMIGHSMGGYITLAFAEKYPGFLYAFGLFHSSAYADSDEKKATRQKGIDFIQQNGAFEFLKTATRNLFSPKTKDERPELIDEQIAGLSNFLAPSLVSYYRAMMERPDRTAILEKANTPVLFIAGKYDTAIPLEDSLRQCHLPEKSYFHVLHQSGHLGMLEETDQSNTIIDDFLNGI